MKLWKDSNESTYQNMDGLPDSAFEFLDFLSRLSEEERNVVNYIYRNIRCTLNQLKNVFDFDVNKVLSRLCDKKIVYKYSFLNFSFYELNLRTKMHFYYERFPAGPVIPLIYHYNLLCDEPRVKALKKAIDKTVKKDDLVLEIGCGTGILAILCAEKKAKVFAVEIDPFVAESAEFFVKNSGLSDQIHIIQGDVREFSFDTKFDIIICEMLDTGLIAELQVPIMNIMVEKYKKESTKIIPQKAYTYAQLIYKDYRFFGFDFKLIHYEEYNARKTVKCLSKPYLYHTVSFEQINEVDCDFEVSLTTEKEGIVNGIKITTEIEIYNSEIIKGSAWFNPPLVLPVEDMPVKKGDTLTLRLSYGLGKGFPSISYELVSSEGGDNNVR